MSRHSVHYCSRYAAKDNGWDGRGRGAHRNRSSLQSPPSSTMAKSDSFFIRHTTEIDNDNAYYQDSIDLGAYVDALGKSVLRIHNIAVQMSDSTGRTSEVTSSGSAPFNGAAAQFQLCTQSQTDIVLASNKSIISSGRIVCQGNGGVPGYVSQDFDNPATLDQRLSSGCGQHLPRRSSLDGLRW